MVKRVAFMTDSDSLKSKQYKDSSNLGARIALHVDYSTNPVGVWDWFFNLLLAVGGNSARILEVGCGRGDLWLQNANRIPQGWQVTLTDLSPGMLDDARQNLGNLADRFQMQTANVQDLEFDDAEFDIVIANFMLYHAPDRKQAIGELRRVLKPTGALFACTLGDDHMRQFWELVQRVDPTFESSDTRASHTFGLENGAEQIGSAFGDIVEIPYFCNLEVTEAQPLLAYLHSNGGEEILSGKYDEPFLEQAQRQIDEQGHVFIQKSTGCFVARGYTS
jgi:SAM-dependent methyltransferase